ncbi:mandelate racemase [Salmonella enterica subsp. enterica]|uniref:Mandelate racemase n=1 Tax=Salmonella enterica I TaxID=59201 RepID=A0A379VZP1_SALET|nr:mandelate racemase [Salmonella enterica subsp. enterica]
MKITSVDIIDVANDFASATSKWRPVVVKINTMRAFPVLAKLGWLTASALLRASEWRRTCRPLSSAWTR